jgi:hypothetical protein
MGRSTGALRYSDVTALANSVNTTNEVLRAAFARGRGPEFELAAKRCWAVVNELEATYDSIVAGVRTGNTGSIDDALTVLEAEVRCFRSGYGAERLLHALANAELNPAQRARAVQYVKDAVRRPTGREFRRIANLAHELAPELNEWLLVGLASDEPRVTRHCLWIISNGPAITLTREQRDLARSRIVEVLARTPDDHLQFQQWERLTPCARRLWTPDWSRELFVAGVLGEPTSGPHIAALCLLPTIPLSDDERARLREVIVRDARLGVGTLSPGTYSPESLVSWARDPELVDELQRVMDEPQPGDERLYVFWARNAAMRSVGLDPRTRPVDL